MNTSLFPHYERELRFIRRDVEGFARQYPTAAEQLLLAPQRSGDPHVERMIEAFALLTARVQKRIDDDFPEITDGLLASLYPHYLAPVPSLTIVQMHRDPANAEPTGLKIRRGTRLRSPAVEGVPCRFRTCYPLTLWPIRVATATLETAPFDPALRPPAGSEAILRLRLQTEGDLDFGQLPLRRLRFHLHGDDILTARLYETLFNQVTRVEYRTASGKAVEIAPADALGQVGFGSDEGLLPYPPQSHLAYRLLTELFAFPAKFAFFDLQQLDRALTPHVGRSLEAVLYLRSCDPALLGEVDAGLFRLGCTPAVNLFDKICEPIQLNQTRTSYRVTPDVHCREHMEVHAINKVIGVGPGKTVEYRPFYGLNHENSWKKPSVENAYWYAERKPAGGYNERVADTELRLVDLDFSPRFPADRSITVQATCSNCDLPGRLPAVGVSGWRFELESSESVKAVQCLRQPTLPLRPPLGRRGYWRLISHLSVNHLSLSGGPDSLAALQELLRLYDHADDNSNRRQAIINSEMIDGIVNLKTDRATARIGGALEGGFCRGIDLELLLDEQKYGAVGSFLFASVLERFFGQYASVNSFTRVRLATQQSGFLRQWVPRSGEVPLL